MWTNEESKQNKSSFYILLRNDKGNVAVVSQVYVMNINRGQWSMKYKMTVNGQLCTHCFITGTHWTGG